MTVEFWVNDSNVPTVPFGNATQGELNSGKRRLMWTFPNNQAEEAQEFARTVRVPSPIPPSTPDVPDPLPPAKQEIFADIQAASSVAEIKAVLIKMLKRL